MITVEIESPETIRVMSHDTWEGAQHYAIRNLHQLDIGNVNAGRRWRDQATKAILRTEEDATVHADKITIQFMEEDEA